VTKAAKVARVGRSTAYEWREEDKAFAAAWDEAIEESNDVLEGEAYRRAVTGTLEPVFYQGEKVGTVRRYSDSLLTLLLKSNRPAKFKDRTDITSGDQPLKAYMGFDPEEV